MEFGLLGTVEVWVDGEPLPLGPPKRRGLLALLLLELGQPVPVERLVDLLWLDEPPPEARRTVMAHISRLRGTLSAAGPAGDGVRLVTAGSGYALHADPSRVDALRFRELCEQARAAGDDGKALHLFDEALHLWRGPALTGAGPERLRARLAYGLDEARATAQADRIDTLLQLGRPDQALADLADLVHRYPLRERLVGQQMLAHYHAGRTADALAACARLRQRLADELGLDLGPALRDLERAILRQDPHLVPVTVEADPAHGLDHAAAAPTAVSGTGAVAASSGQRAAPAAGSGGGPAGPVPAQLPPTVAGFTGREPEVAELDAAGSDADAQALRIVAVSGMAGVGKTTLAVYWAHRVRDHFPDGQLYLNLRGFDPGGTALDPAEALRCFLDALAVPAAQIPRGLAARTALYRSLLADRRMLIVLDNARDEEQVRPLLPGSAASLVVVTSRNQLRGLIAVDGARPVGLAPLDQHRAGELLTYRLGQRRAEAEPTALRDLVTRCAGLPLALTIVAARAATAPSFSLAAVLAELDSVPRPLDALSGGDPGTDMRAVLSWSYSALPAATARLFRLLGLHPGPEISAAVAASLSGVPPTRVRGLLAELTRAHLVTESSPGRYHLHDLLRSYAIERTHRDDPAADRDAAIRRMLDHYLRTGHRAALLIYPHRDPIELPTPAVGADPEELADSAAAMAWFTAERPVLLALVDLAAAHGADTHVWQLSWTLYHFLDWRCQWDDWEHTQQASLAAADRLADPVVQARGHQGLARVYLRMGCLDDAARHCEHAIRLLAGLGDHVAQAHNLINLGWVAERQGRLADALGHAEQARELYRRSGHRSGEADAINAVGWYAGQLGDHRRALRECRAALAVQQEIGDELGAAATWDSLGYTHSRLDEYDEAVQCYERAVTLYSNLGELYEQADTYHHLGHAHVFAGHPERARSTWLRAAAILDELGQPEAVDLRRKLAALAAQPIAR